MGNVENYRFGVTSRLMGSSADQASSSQFVCCRQPCCRRGHRLAQGVRRAVRSRPDRLSCEPLSGHLFLFCNAQRNRLKVLVWDGSGLWVCAKRLEKGRFTWPQSGDAQGKVVLSHEELPLLLGGIDLSKTKHKRWYRKAPVVSSKMFCVCLSRR